MAGSSTLRQPHVTVVLADAGDHVVAGRLRLDVVHEAALVVVRLHPDGLLRRGLQPRRKATSGTTQPARSAVLQHRQHGVGRRGDGHPDQSVAAPRDVVGVAGEVADEQVARAGPLPRQPQAYDAAPARLGDADEGLVRGELHAVGERQAGQVHLHATVGATAQQPATAGVLDEVGPPSRQRMDLARVGEPDVAVAGHGGVVADQDAVPVDLGGQSLHDAGAAAHREEPLLGVADEDALGIEQLEAEGATAGVADLAQGAVGTDPEDVAVVGAGPDVALLVDDDVLGAHAGHVDPSGRGLESGGHEWLPWVSAR